MNNPIEGNDGFWYWYTEDQYKIGPYPNRDTALEGLGFYTEWKKVMATEFDKLSKS